MNCEFKQFVMNSNRMKNVQCAITIYANYGNYLQIISQDKISHITRCEL